MTSLFGMTHYDRILYLSSPGVLLNPAPLDSLLAYAPEQSFAALRGSNPEHPSISDSLYLLRPSKKMYTNFTQTLSTTPTSDFSLLSNAFPVPGAYFPEYLLPASSPLVSTTSSLTFYSERDIKTSFNTSDFLDNTAWVRLWDPELPGPEYDVPYHERHRVAPKDENARIVWERLYNVFQEDRMEVCGLDLETYHEAKAPEQNDEAVPVKMPVEDKHKEQEVKLQIEGILSGEGRLEKSRPIDMVSGGDSMDGILM